MHNKDKGHIVSNRPPFMRIYKFVTTEQKDVIILEDVLVDNYKI